MTGRKISQLPSITGAEVSGSDMFVLVDADVNETKQINTEEMSNALVSINGGIQGGFTVYANTTLGIANTSNNGYFFIPSSNTSESLALYKNTSNTATYVTGIPKSNLAENPFGGMSRQEASDIKAIYIYDTTKDSDGGAWRKKCQHTSWYEELGQFPKRALIVARADSVTIYDLDSGSPELWMTFEASLGNSRYLSRGSGGAVRDVKALNGCVVAGTGGASSSVSYDGIAVFDFVTDTAHRYSSNGAYTNPVDSLSRRNAAGYSSATNSARVLVDNDVNSIAMRVMPGTPRNPQRHNLPDPTIVVGTDGGVSIIHPDGNVADITWPSSTGVVGKVAFRPTDGALCITTAAISTQARFRHVYHQLTISDVTNTHGYVKGVADEMYPLWYNASYTGTAFALGPVLSTGWDSVGFNGLYDAGSIQLTSFLPEPSAPEKGARAVITNTFNTGYQVGDIKLALAESTADVTSLVGSGELVTNGTFSTDISSWTEYQATAAVSSAEATITLAAGQTVGGLYQDFAVTAGVAYVVSATVRIGTADNISLRIQDAASFTALTIDKSTTSASAVTLTGYWIPTAANNRVYIRVSGAETETAIVDSVTVRRAATDRSVSGNHPIINGTITRAAVA